MEGLGGKGRRRRATHSCLQLPKKKGVREPSSPIWPQEVEMKVIVDDHKRGMMQEASVTTLVKNVGDTLYKHYPDHMWAVGPSNDYSMLAIWNESLSSKWGMWIRVEEIDPDYKNIVRWAGELLERAKLSRGAAKLSEINSIKRDAAGDAVFDV